jgi:hypothetical protein
MADFVVLGCGKTKVAHDEWHARCDAARDAHIAALGIDPEAELEPGEEQLVLRDEDVVGLPRLRDLYTGNLYRARLAYAEALGGPSIILSAFYGARLPDYAGAAPYERVLSPKTDKETRAWVYASATAAVFARTEPGDRVIILASAAYAEGWTIEVERAGRIVERPLRGLGIGQQLAWLKQATAALRQTPPSVPTTPRSPSPMKPADRPTPKRGGAKLKVPEHASFGEIAASVPPGEALRLAPGPRAHGQDRQDHDHGGDHGDPDHRVRLSLRHRHQV